MSAFNGLLEGVQVADILLVAVTTMLVASVVVGGMRYLRRSRPAVATAGRSDSPDEAVEAAVAAYKSRVGEPHVGAGDELVAWEAELAERIDELETAFASLATRLTRVGPLQGDSADVLQSIVRTAGSTTVRSEALSEEQSQLLARIANRATGGAIGAGS